MGFISSTGRTDVLYRDIVEDPDAADELVRESFVPDRDIWFSSSSTEETTGEGADEIARWFEAQGIRFEMLFDEGGMILTEPI